ncbi:hypothetical protein NEIELOOT_03036 [Neisseria elongata subsp. glycolytica ATCC 29315]|uniref:Uncharacterized protein n=1 Tax=Neisseria elongata subsp. glycolytica ATCC 29315 TaxID=546263 RepID=D4DVB9_NEIEG|nr:hypothetical protein NEIELOOT_03036 [Neisseria elongata subsp. glycolytica ATCC 29315]
MPPLLLRGRLKTLFSFGQYRFSDGLDKATPVDTNLLNPADP